MRQIGLPNSKFKEEFRIALLPKQVRQLSHPELLFFQKEYGKRLGIRDREYERAGANITNWKGAYGKEVLCQAKFCDGDLPYIQDGQTVFGWIHLTVASKMFKAFQRKKVTSIAWEHMYKGKKHVFARNNYLTGQTGVLHAMAYAPMIPEECRAAVIGRGNVGKGAKDELRRLGVKSLRVYHSKNPIDLICDIGNYDIIVHCAGARHQIISRDDLRRMKKGAVLVHLGNDCIKDDVESRSIYNPVKCINGDKKNIVYSVNHVPTLPFQTSSRYVSEDVKPYIDKLVEGEMDKTLRDAVVVDKGLLLRL